MITFDQLKEDLSINFPDLYVREVDGTFEVLGGHSVLSKEGAELDRFSLRIVVPQTFPADLPIVYETGGRIPRVIKFHINSDGTCCVGVQAAAYHRLGQNFPLSSYIRGPLHDYLVFQALKLRGHTWEVGEAEHGYEGVVRFWADQLGVSEPLSIAMMLLAATKGKPPPKNSKCPCGSKLRSRRCHRRVIGDIAKHYPKDHLLWDVNRALKFHQQCMETSKPKTAPKRNLVRRRITNDTKAA